ncbi:DUF2589 domain-containing protein [Lentzea sp. NPDC058450]|uniref:DUF2589 domain-containing protein n=1 Tax=Lentzea sp. NPDC058450 TaxID=3346505 RepID=UPI00365884E7
MPDPGTELSSLNFESLIGGPLVAAVHAQVQSALATVNFVKQVGFKPPAGGSVEPGDTSTGDPATVTFTYRKDVPKPDGTTESRDVQLTVPLLAILPVPFLRIDQVDVDFLAKIESVQFRQVDQQVEVGADLDAQAAWGWGSARLRASFAFQRDTKEGSKDTRTYSMGVKARAVQDEMPGGMSKVLTILESLIKEEVAS